MDLPARVANLEAASQKSAERLVSIERDVAVIKSNYATKEDVTALRGEMKAAVAEAKYSIIIWVVSAIVLAQLLPALLKKLGL